MTDDTDMQAQHEPDALAQRLERAIVDIDTEMSEAYDTAAASLKTLEKGMARTDKQLERLAEDTLKSLDALDAVFEQ